MDMLKGTLAMLAAMMLSMPAIAADTTKPAVRVVSSSPVRSAQAAASSAAQPVEASAREEVPSEEVLPEGAKIVAGDPDKNEFFIVGKGQPIPEVKMERIKHLEKMPEVPAKPQLAGLPKKIHKLPIKELASPHRKELALNEIPKPNVIIVHGEYREQMRPHLERKPVYIDEPELAPLPHQYMVASLAAELTKPLRMQTRHVPAPDLNRALHQVVHKGDGRDYMAQLMKQALNPNARQATYQQRRGFRGLVTNEESSRVQFRRVIEQPTQYVQRRKSSISMAAAFASAEKKTTMPHNVESLEASRSIRVSLKNRTSMPVQHVYPSAKKHLVAAATKRHHLQQRQPLRKQSNREAGIQVISIADAEKVKQLSRMTTLPAKKRNVQVVATRKMPTRKKAVESTRPGNRQIILTDSDYEVVYKNAAYTVKKVKIKG